MNFNDREKIIALTPLWKGERFLDGRPKVPDKYLDALYGMTLEEVWKPIFVLGKLFVSTFVSKFVRDKMGRMEVYNDR